MSTTGAISIEDETGIVQLAGTATFPDGLTVSDVETPDVATGDSGGITIKTGDAAAGDAGNILIQGGSGDFGSGAGGDVTILPGPGDTDGVLLLQDSDGHDRLSILGASLSLSANVHVTAGVGTSGTVDIANGFAVWGHSIPGAQPAITGALSAVTDAAAKDVLTSILAALVGYGLATDGTT